MRDFNAKHVNLGSEETNHYGTKLMDILSYGNLFVVQNNNQLQRQNGYHRLHYNLSQSYC